MTIYNTSDCCSCIIGFSATESKTLQETPEESYYRRNLGRVSRVQPMDKAQESIVEAALTRFLSHCQVHLPLQSGQDMPSSCQKQEIQNISMRFSSKQHVSVHGSFSSLYYCCQQPTWARRDCLATVTSTDIKCQMYWAATFA